MKIRQNEDGTTTITITAEEADTIEAATEQYAETTWDAAEYAETDAEAKETEAESRRAERINEALTAARKNREAER